MAYLTKEVNPSLTKPLLKFDGGLAKLQGTFLVKEKTGEAELWGFLWSVPE